MNIFGFLSLKDEAATSGKEIFRSKTKIQYAAQIQVKKQLNILFESDLTEINIGKYNPKIGKIRKPATITEKLYYRLAQNKISKYKPLK